MSNPRKFSEKIALMAQKQREEDEAFRLVMAEVRTVVSGPRQPSMPQPTPGSRLLPPTNQGHMLRGGSLPDVHSGSISHQNPGHAGPRPIIGSPGRSRPAQGLGPVRTDRRRNDTSPYASPPSAGNNHSPSSNPMSVGSPRNNYQQQYLHPPQEWRRVHSDPALHRPPADDALIPLVVPESSNSEESSKDSTDPNTRVMFSSLSQITRTEQEQLNAFGNGGIVHLGVTQPNASTGSLPDLTNPGNIQFPMPTDIDASSIFSTRSPGQNSVAFSPTMNSHPLNVSLNGILSQGNQQQLSPGQVPSPQSQSQHSPIILDHLNAPFPNFTSTDNSNMYNYRCPPRPSPQNSPFRSPSPLDNHLSNPPSPITQMNQNPSAESYTNVLQQSFEHVSLDDRSRNGGTWQSGLQNEYFYNPLPSPAGNPCMASNTNTQPQQQQQQSPHLPQPATPQTPGSIPEIIFSDFTESDRFADAEEFLEQQMTAMRNDIDSDDLEMLRNPNLIITSEPNAEDTFRLDRLDCERELAEFLNS